MASVKRTPSSSCSSDPVSKSEEKAFALESANKVLVETRKKLESTRDQIAWSTDPEVLASAESKIFELAAQAAADLTKLLGPATRAARDVLGDESKIDRIRANAVNAQKPRADALAKESLFDTPLRLGENLYRRALAAAPDSAERVTSLTQARQAFALAERGLALLGSGTADTTGLKIVGKTSSTGIAMASMLNALRTKLDGAT